jgi:hypothetical protein
VGELGAADVDIGLDPWSSDHRAVVSDFVVSPAPAPSFVSVDGVLTLSSEGLTAGAYELYDAYDVAALAP